MTIIPRVLHRISKVPFGEIVTKLFMVLIKLVLAIATLIITRILALNTSLSPTIQFLIIGMGGILIVALSIVFEIIAAKESRKKIANLEIGFTVVGTAIQNMTLLDRNPQEERKKFISEVLRYIEKIVSSVLESWNIERGEICANLMVKSDGTPPILKIEEFGTELENRSRHIKLVLDDSSPRVGAIEAYFEKKLAYVSDTHAEKYKGIFRKEDIKL